MSKHWKLGRFTIEKSRRVEAVTREYPEADVCRMWGRAKPLPQLPLRQRKN